MGKWKLTPQYAHGRGEMGMWKLSYFGAHGGYQRGMLICVALYADIIEYVLETRGVKGFDSSDYESTQVLHEGMYVVKYDSFYPGER